MIKPEPWTGRLIGRMHNNKVTLEQLAAHLGWTKSYCSMILNGQRKPRGIREKMEAAVSDIIKIREEKKLSMANIQIFTSPEFGDIRTVDQNGEPWFVGKDVAAALGYGNPQKAIRDHVDEQDRGMNEMDTPGGKQPIAIINESGLYSLIFGSKLEGAVRFKRWVTSEVLPALRKTGSYMMPKLSKEMQALFMLDNRTQRQEERLTALENTMTVDYNQQRVLRKAISRAVIAALGGEDTPAYIDNHVRSKVYSECNHDVQDWFRVNSVGNIPRKRFDEAVEYIQRWKPSTNTVMLIQQTNGQTSLFAAAAAKKNTTTAGKFVKEV